METKINSILIVDDTPKNLQVLGNTLKLENFKVEFAINGFQALEWIEKKEFDLILLDVMMPEMDGYEVCEKIRANDKNKNLPIIFLTAKTDSESIVRGFEIGAQDYITKPFNTAELLVRVKTQLELKNSRKKLESLNEWLDGEVKKRTLELENANVNLEKANNELMGLDKAKTDFLTIISNEIRTPLNGIMGTLHILKDKIDSIEMVNLLNVLNTSVVRLEKFSSYALLITSIRTQKYKLNTESVNFAELIDFALFELSNVIKENKVQISNELPDDMVFDLDNKLFIKALSGIFETLIRHCLGSTLLRIMFKNVDSRNIIEIIGQNTPFSSDQLESDFNDFTDDKNGFGIEFNLANLIVQAHGARIELQNVDNQPVIYLIGL
ncbi:MAG: hybrid sensor histidine kinase/response regulator [Salinivirgaceae bacterium]|jgi:two-component system sensor histidine kinase/response regulator|nr:hybrid sensor histidine kinase/response regulator [Salinivirgaceae bacterium]